MGPPIGPPYRVRMHAGCRRVVGVCYLFAGSAWLCNHNGRSQQQPAEPPPRLSRPAPL